MVYYYIYYLELKNRLILLILTWISVSVVCYLYQKILVFEIVDVIKYAGLSKKNPYFIFSDVTDLFSVYFHLIFFISNHIVLILFIYHLLMFLSPGLYLFELTNLIFILRISFVNWIFTVILVNYFFFPFCWNFFLSFHDPTDKLSNISFLFEINIKEYVWYYTRFYYLCAVNFQFSCFLLFGLTNFNNRVHSIKKFRKIVYFFFLIFSTFITPPDVFSQILLTLFFIVFYESLIVLRLYDKTIY